VYKVEDPQSGTHKIMRERVGLLSLTAYNDSTAEAVTKRDVDLYLNERIEHEIILQRMRIGKSSDSIDGDEPEISLSKGEYRANEPDEDDVIHRSIQQYSKPQQIEQTLQQETEEQNILIQIILLILAFLGLVFIGEKTAKLARK
jgi:hypothetical protein